MLLTLFGSLPSAWRLSVMGGAAVIAIGAFTTYSIKVYNAGWRDAIAGVASRNGEHIRAVRKAVSSVSDCNASGGSWDTVSGVCQ